MSNPASPAKSVPSRCVVAAFEDRNEAEKALDELLQSGFRHEDVGFVLRGSDVGKGGMITDEVGAKDGPGAVAGIVTGGLIGGLLAAASALVIPGVGPFLAGGILAEIIGFAGAGAAVGGIFGALKGLEVSEDEAKYFTKEFETGKALVAVKPGTNVALANEIMARHGGVCARAR